MGEPDVGGPQLCRWQVVNISPQEITPFAERGPVQPAVVAGPAHLRAFLVRTLGDPHVEKARSPRIGAEQLPHAPLNGARATSMRDDHWDYFVMVG